MKVLLIGSDTPIGQALCNFFDLRGTDYAVLTKSGKPLEERERQAKKALRRSEASIALDVRIQAQRQMAASVSTTLTSSAVPGWHAPARPCVCHCCCCPAPQFSRE